MVNLSGFFLSQLETLAESLPSFDRSELGSMWDCGKIPLPLDVVPDQHQ